MLRLGCPIWSNPDWVGSVFSAAARPQDYLRQYARAFTTVEGNNTFYGLPKAATVQRWLADTPAEFRFCFKFPKAISHEARLRGAGPQTREFLQRLEPLRERLGPLFLQLPPSFAGRDQALLDAYLDQLPGGFDYAVEVRHADFFRKGEPERRFNRGLAERGIDRVVLDSRALFSAPAADPDTRSAQRKKPRLPARVVALGPRPLVRFIGHPEVDANRPFLQPWLAKIDAWLADGREPYVFLHTPNNRLAPQLVRLLRQLLGGDAGSPWAGETEAAAVAEQRELF